MSGEASRTLAVVASARVHTLQPRDHLRGLHLCEHAVPVPAALIVAVPLV